MGATGEESRSSEDKEKEKEDNSDEDKSDEDAPRFSLIDMKLKPKHHQPSQEKEGEEGVSTDLVLLNNERTLATISPAAAYLAKREWKGLEQRIGESEVVLAVEGMEGLPMGYTHEPGLNKSSHDHTGEKED